MEFQNQILQQLELRDKNEHTVFINLFQDINNSKRNWRKCEVRVQFLENENVELKQLNQEIQKSLDSLLAGGKISHTNTKEVEELKRKLDESNQKLIGFLSTQNESNQKLIELNEKLRAREEEVRKLKESEISLKSTLKDIEESFLVSDETREILKGELEAFKAQSKEVEKNFRAHIQDLELQHTIDRDQLKEKDMLIEKLQKLQETQAAKIIELEVKLDSSLQGKTRDDASPSKRDSLVPQDKLSIRLRKKMANAHESEINCVSIAQSGNSFATGSGDKKIKIFETNTGKIVNMIQGFNQGVTNVEFNSKEEILLASSNDYTAKVWTVSTWRSRFSLTGHTNKLYTVKASYDTTRAVTGSYDRTIKIWDLNKGNATKTLTHTSTANDLCFLDEASHTIISGHFDGSLRLWDIRSGETVKELSNICQSQITSLSPFSEKRRVLINSKDNNLKVLDLRMFEVVQTYSAEGFHNGSACSRSTVSPDGLFISAGSNNGSVFIWDVLSSKVAKVLKENSGIVNSVCWSQTGESLVAVDRDKNVVIWEIVR